MKRLFLIAMLTILCPLIVYGQPITGGGYLPSSGGTVGGAVTFQNNSTTFGDGTGPVVLTFSITGTDPTFNVAEGMTTYNQYWTSNKTVNQNTIPSFFIQQYPLDQIEGWAYTGTDYTQTTRYIAVKVGPLDQDRGIGDVLVRVKASGTITNKKVWLTAYWYSSSGSPAKPNSLLITGSDSTLGYLTTSYQNISFAIPYDCTLGSYYWLVIGYEETPSGASVIWDSDVSANDGATSDDALTWTNTNVRLRYQVRGKTGNSVYAKSYNGSSLYGWSETNAGFTGESIGSYGGYAYSHNFTALGAESKYRDAFYAKSTYSYAAKLTINPPTTDTIDEVLRIERNTSGTAANGIGGAINYYAENNAGTLLQLAQIAGIFTDVTASSEDSAITFSTRAAGGAVTEAMRLINGTLQIGPNAATASAQTIKGPDSTAALAAGGDLILSGGTPGAGGVYGGVTVGMGTTGGYKRGIAEATGTPAGTTTTFVITLSIPTGARLLGCQLRVDTALTAGETWKADFSGGSTTVIAAAGQLVAKDTKINKMIVDEITTNTTNVTITRDAGNFTNGVGVIRAIVYYDTFSAMANAP